MLGTEATKVGSDLVCSNNGVSLFPSPGSMAKGEEDGEDGEVVLFGCSIALIQYSIMRWSGSVGRSVGPTTMAFPSIPPSPLGATAPSPAITVGEWWSIAVTATPCLQYRNESLRKCKPKPIIPLPPMTVRNRIKEQLSLAPAHQWALSIS